MTDLENSFAPGGALSVQLPGFRPRPAQQAMAQAIADVIEAGGCLVAEAGTGTGKTLAYLLPAMLSGKKLIVSTATKTLQDQLFRKDLPLVRRALNRPVRVALLKGRSNYLCLYRLEHTLGFKAGQGPRDAEALAAIRRWARNTQTGDIGEASGLPENSPHWAAATSTADNCLGQECPRHGECFLVQARSRAREADVLVINHHLLWADWTLKNEGLGELLPQADVIIVDEAHQFLESASQFLGLGISSRQLADLANDVAVERFKDAPDVPHLLEEAERLERLIDDFRLALGEDSRRDAWHTVADLEPVGLSMDAIRAQLAGLAGMLNPLIIRGKGLESCHTRCLDLGNRLDIFMSGDSVDAVRWFETRKRSFALNRTPLAIAGEFTKFRTSSSSAWIFTSATLTVGGKFDHFSRQLGLSDARLEAWDSPFDYANNCRIYLPEGLPEPSSRHYNASVIAAALPVIKSSGGRAFVLFTSHQALAEAATTLSSTLEYPLFVQGTQPKTRLLEQFKAAGNGVLLGTATFWEGVDVPGPALSCVIIDKLPFASPSDPVLSARLDSMQRAGHNPFVSYQLPAAIIALKQGVGRLIRDHGDRGILMLCDPRLLTRPYGKLFLNSLPEIPRIRAVAEVEQFFSSFD